MASSHRQRDPLSGHVARAQPSKPGGFVGRTGTEWVDGRDAESAMRQRGVVSLLGIGVPCRKGDLYFVFWFTQVRNSERSGGLVASLAPAIKAAQVPPHPPAVRRRGLTAHRLVEQPQVPKHAWQAHGCPSCFRPSRP
jgi:hypothetical protein